jgi:HPt (histidine-containing phosphotransfer) domain-containing protein
LEPIGTAKLLPVLDLEPLRTRCLNDDSFLKRVLSKALARIPVDVQNVLSAADKTDFDGIARGAHALAGMSANLEAQQLLAAARDLEQLARNREAATLPTLLVDFRQAAQQAEDALQRLHSELTNSGVA